MLDHHPEDTSIFTAKSKWRLDLLKEKIYFTDFYQEHKDADLNYDQMCEMMRIPDWDGDPEIIYEKLKMLPKALELHKTHAGLYRQRFWHWEPIERHLENVKKQLELVKKLNTVKHWKDFPAAKIETVDHHKICTAAYDCLAYETWDEGLELVDEVLKFFDTVYPPSVKKDIYTPLPPCEVFQIPYSVFNTDRANWEWPRRRVSFTTVKGAIYKHLKQYDLSKEAFSYYLDDVWNTASAMTQWRSLESGLEIWEFDKDPAIEEKLLWFFNNIQKNKVGAHFEGVPEGLLIMYMFYEIYLGKEIK